MQELHDFCMHEDSAARTLVYFSSVCVCAVFAGESYLPCAILFSLNVHFTGVMCSFSVTS
jgi:hypothetical protein